MRKLLIVLDSADPDVQDLMTRLAINEVTDSIPPKYIDRDITLPAILIEDGDDILEVISITDISTFTYDFSTVVAPVRPPAKTTLEDVIQEVLTLRAELNIVKGKLP